MPKDYSIVCDSPYVMLKSKRASIVISREWSFEANVEQYINHYLNRFILSPQYQKENNIVVTENTVTKKQQRISAVINDLPSEKFNKYTYVYIKTKSPNFYRLMFKYHADDLLFEEQIINEVINSFEYFSQKPSHVGIPVQQPIIPNEWSLETKTLYKNLTNSNTVYWGIFAQDIYQTGIEKTIPALESKLEYSFPVVLCYMQFGSRFPLEFMQNNYSDRKLVELTYQISTSNNEQLFGYTRFMAIYRGKKDEEIRIFAKEAKKFGHPFLFRLCNEPNSDWTSYSAVVNMCDPEIYIENWKRIYNIFKQEGVDNAIWVFNPNDKSYPPCNWNDFFAFYPGNEYIQIIGITGYNTGTYYKNERWREFEDIYDEIYKKYFPAFNRFPWIITEFASSSVGGSKPLWIKNMFKCLNKYPQIKIAVWFNYADFEIHTEDKKIVSRPYWLDETPETLIEFKRGMQSFDNNELINH
ncbi:MAG: hypothetical protein GX800_13480 [Clostridiaceae bacterium]|nr:hypothetical protein [Clostridiaceae bacterium]